MEFAETLKLIGEYGVPIVICGVFVLIALVGVVLFKKWFEKKYLKEPTPAHNEAMKTRFKITPEVKCKLRELLLHTHASRAYVFEFHNGTTGFGGLPFIYMSCTYEVLSQAASSQQLARQRMPFTLYESLIIQIIEKDTVSVDTRNKSDKFDNIIYETLAKRGTTVLIGTKLVDENKRIIGFLGIDYCGNPNKALINDGEDAIKEIEKIVFSDAQALSALLYVKISKEDV